MYRKYETSFGTFRRRLIALNEHQLATLYSNKSCVVDGHDNMATCVGMETTVVYVETRHTIASACPSLQSYTSAALLQTYRTGLLDAPLRVSRCKGITFNSVAARPYRCII